MKKILFAFPVLLLIFCSCNRTPVELANVEKVDGTTVLINDDNPYSGQVQMKYENGETIFIENIKDGKKHGNYLSYYKSGQKKTEGRYENGKRKGVWKWWNEKGEVNYEVDYSSNVSLRF